MKKYIVISLILITVVFLFLNSQTDKQIENVIIKNNSSSILEKRLEFTQYKDLSDDHKSIYDSFINKTKNNKDFVFLVFSDKKVALFFVSNEKVGGDLYLYDLHNWNKLDSANLYQSKIKKEYLLFPCTKNDITESFCYYKSGAKKIVFIENSNLTVPNETYIGSIGPGGNESYFDFDENSKTLKVSIFKSSVENDNWSYIKLREVEFVLP